MLRTGDRFERTFQTSQGPVDFLAEIVVNGETSVLNDVAIYGRSQSNLTGLAKEALAAREGREGKEDIPDFLRNLRSLGSLPDASDRRFPALAIEPQSASFR